MVLKGQDYTFKIDRLNHFNSEETFKLSVVLQRNNVPVTQFMKEFLYEEEFTSDKTFKFENAQDLEVKCSDSLGNKVKVKFSVMRGLHESSGGELSERDGLRLLVGRYVIYQKRIALLRQINRDLTVDLQNLSTGTIRQNVKMKKVKMIEHSGVNVYDLTNLPKAISGSKYEWIVECRTRSKRLVNIITSGVQDRQTYKSFSARSFNRDKKRDIEGKILISVLEALDLKLPDSRLQVRVTSGPGEGIPQTFQTEVLSKGASTWVSAAQPNGCLLDFGTHFFEEPCTLKFELLSHEYRQTT